ncbi:molybdopterin cofactor-binding domain-containing protein [Nocardioides massiliensis]|uniref:CO/xanthine dehydrogenase Mo-binding subunit/CO/xanthine dehydrogenase FAD-binding subunit n=1 Tax=Nocardioides massiliensis TaxID=1325935 RepID=A0ABT9NN37_9ACTN|nr:molybdopterin cofactor-binding domain-containing protein [Nocardioides massiliensis]MDP9821833.1 CO/xanthine dehydrogenase Mo-binding subunit/CO/xanthine dehydrogenase FAD-binding subunit [Nocardioides massiliensis]
MSYVGARVRPLDWDDRTRGRVLFTADLSTPEHLHAAVLRSPHPYAEIVTLDVSAAERMPGVHAVITKDDFRPGITYLHRGAPLSDRPPLADSVVRHVGQEVAAVAAETPAIARAALAAIKVKYRVRRAPLTPRAALEPAARRLHERVTDEANVAVLLRTDWGDVASGQAAGIHTVEGEYVYPSVSHACMEPNTTLAAWDEEGQRVELWTSTQAPWFIAKEVAHLLEIPHSHVICREVAVGGGFGSKSKASEHEVLAAALSRKARRPVLLELTREEEFGANKPRHRFETRLRTSADARGTIRLFDADILVDNGSYNHMGSSVMRVGVITLGSMYRPDGARFAARLVDTATQPGGQFRGYGTPQVSLAVESQVDDLARELGLDPLQMRLDNLGPEYATTLCGYAVTTSRLEDCLRAVRDGLDWDQRKEEHRSDRADRGLGVAAGMHGSGAYAYEMANRSDAAVDVFADGRVRVRHGSADAGTGQNTILAQIAATELGVDLDDVDVLSMDSELTPFELGAWSSRGTHMTGSSVGLAARELRDKIRALAAVKLGSDDVELRDGKAVAPTGEVDLGDLVLLSDEARDGCLSHEVSYVLDGTEMISPDKDRFNLSPTYAYAAHGALVEVDRRTGKVQVLDYVAAHDVGTALNPTAVEGQIAGGAAMGLGAALGEELIREGGRVVNSTYLHYAMPRSADLPSIRPVIVNADDPAGPYGAKSVGEMSIIPPGAAIANAVADAVGVRITELPITPDKVLTALARQEGRVRRHGLWRRPDRWWIALLRWLYPRGLHSALHRWGTKLGPKARSSAPPAPPRVLRPDTVDELTAATVDGAQPIGGGTDAVVERERQSRPAPVLISTIGVPSMRLIRQDGDALRIGAAVTLAELEESLPESLGYVVAAVASIASPQIRNSATVGGNLAQEKRCWFFRNGFSCYKRNGVTSPCYAVDGDHRFQHAVIDGHRCQAVTPSDLGTVLQVADARVVIARGEARRQLSLADLYDGPGELALHEGEVITELVVPLPSPTSRSSFKKLALYQGDFATASATVSADIVNGVWSNVRIVLGAIGPVPWRATETERALDGTTPSAAGVRSLLDRELNAHAHPLANNAWKLDAVAGLVEHAVEDLLAS